jgi:hypothetical protein
VHEDGRRYEFGMELLLKLLYNMLRGNETIDNNNNRKAKFKMYKTHFNVTKQTLSIWALKFVTNLCLNG